MKKILLMIVALMLMAGCASTARISPDGRTITTRSFPGQSVEARFPDGGSIRSGFWEGPKQLGLAYKEGSKSTSGLDAVTIRNILNREGAEE